MASYLFVFGRTPELSYVELQSMFPAVSRVRNDVALISDIPDLNPSDAISLLGGTVKIAEVVNETDEPSVQSLAGFYREGDSTIGISWHADSAYPADLISGIKDELVEMGRTIRYILPHNDKTLSSVVVDKKHIAEILVVSSKNTYIIGKTAAVQPYETWSKRDYGRPHADPKSGMLPPKVARMAVNIALSFFPITNNQLPITLLDPFCGMGTIVGEAVLRHAHVIGADQSQEVVVRAQANLDWLAKTYELNITSRFIGASAEHISEYLGAGTVDCIVTEPFMGNTQIGTLTAQNISKAVFEKLKNRIRGLEKLYIGCLREWQSVLKEYGVIVIAFPEYAIGGRLFFVKKVIDMCENLGYTVVQGPIEYSRPQAIVRRKFYILQKKQSSSS